MAKFKSNLSLAVQNNLFDSELLKAIDKLIEKNKDAAVFHLSIDNFSMLISSQGSQFVEELLDKLETELKENFSSIHAISKTSRDQLSFIMQGVSQEESRKLANDIHYFIQNYGCTKSIAPIHIISTIGVAHFPDHADKAQDVVNHAYVALNDAKQAFQHVAVYKNHKQHQTESKNQLVLASYLQNALLSNRLHLAFQPIVARDSGEVAWYECLLRIEDDKGQLSSAGPFIPIAEKMVFIDLVDSFVLSTVIDELVRNPSVSFALNLSNSTIQSGDWLSMAVKMIENAGVSDRLVLEITETSEQRDTRKVVRFVSTMQAIGCKIALDDFGAGFTSLSQLKHLPVDVVKIDGSYVRDMVYNNESRLFVKTLLDFSHNYGLKTIAEFVENAEIANLLTEMGVDYMQGNYFSPATSKRDWVVDK